MQPPRSRAEQEARISSAEQSLGSSSPGTTNRRPNATPRAPHEAPEEHSRQLIDSEDREDQPPRQSAGHGLDECDTARNDDAWTQNVFACGDVEPVSNRRAGQGRT